MIARFHTTDVRIVRWQIHHLEHEQHISLKESCRARQLTVGYLEVSRLHGGEETRRVRRHLAAVATADAPGDVFEDHARGVGGGFANRQTVLRRELLDGGDLFGGVAVEFSYA